MNYSEAVHDLYALGHELHHVPADKFDLAQMRVLAAGLGDPQKRFPAVLIAGTNGKGSTAATLASILRAAGYRTGLYTSPHLVRINERIRIDGQQIPDSDFARLYDRVGERAQELVSEGRLPNPPSFFETMTAMAFLHFAEQQVQIAVLEVGMGGRLDATNIVEPVASIITDIALDHQKYLGDTIGKIAAEKAGILREGKTAITLPQHPQANQILGERMIEVGARPVSAARNVAPVSPGAEELVECSGGRTRFHLEVLGEEIQVDSPLVGRHQLRNLALAITAAEELHGLGFPMSAKAIAQGICETRWPGRFQVLSSTGERPEIVIDVAHNPAGAWALRAALTEHFGERPRIFVFGAMRDKAIREMAQILLSSAACVVSTTAENPRAASADEIAEIASQTVERVERGGSVREALEKAWEIARRMDAAEGKPVVIITGSIYIVGEAFAALKLEP